MLRCLVVDDEPLAQLLLTDYISKLPFLRLVSTCSDAYEAIEVLQAGTIDLIFADINMPGLTGIQLIESLSVRPMVILITAYEKFAIKGYSLDVVDYLLKPLQPERFIKACNKAQELYLLRQSASQPVNPATVYAPVDYFFVNVEGSLVKLRFQEISWIEGMRDYIKIHFTSHRNAVVTRMSIKAVETELPPKCFIRVHKSFIVSIDAISLIRKSSIFIDRMEIPIGEVYRSAVMQLTGKQQP